MGQTTCDIHGKMVGIGMACTHIIDNIKNGQNEKCVNVRIKYLPGINAPRFDIDLGPLLLSIPFCLQCYEGKKMTERMKVSDDDLEKALKDFEIKYICNSCINDYVERNKLN
jgi:hypothetical protein